MAPAISTTQPDDPLKIMSNHIIPLLKTLYWLLIPLGRKQNLLIPSTSNSPCSTCTGFLPLTRHIPALDLYLHWNIHLPSRLFLSIFLHSTFISVIPLICLFMSSMSPPPATTLCPHQTLCSTRTENLIFKISPVFPVLLTGWMCRQRTISFDFAAHYSLLDYFDSTKVWWFRIWQFSK